MWNFAISTIARKASVRAIVARRPFDPELGINNATDAEASLSAQKELQDSNPFEIHRQGPSGFDETEFKGLRELGYGRPIASRAILEIGGQVIDFNYLYQLDLIQLQKKPAEDYTKLCSEGEVSELLLQDIHEHLKEYCKPKRGAYIRRCAADINKQQYCRTTKTWCLERREEWP